MGCIPIPDLSLNKKLLGNLKSLFGRVIRFYKESSRFKRIIRRNRVVNVYFGDINNSTLKLLSTYLTRNDIKTYFFEEGSSHYSFIDIPHRHNISNVKRAFCRNVTDCLMYLPVYGFRFGKYVYDKSMPWADLRIEKRYSLVPYYNEAYDVVLASRLILSDKVLSAMNQELAECGQCEGKDRILFLSSCVYETIPATKDIYIDMVCEILEDNGVDKMSVIKFHPRESLDVKNKIKSRLKSKGVSFVEISGNNMIPTEYYLTYLSFSKIYCVFTSTYLYNGLLFPKTEFTDVSIDFWNRCNSVGLDVAHQICRVKEITQRFSEILEHTR